MKFSDKQSIIFDLDGTLIDSVPDLADAINRMLESLGREPFDEATIRGWVGNGAPTLVRRALSGGTQIDGSIDETLFERALETFLQAYRNTLCSRTTLFPGAEPMLTHLAKTGYRLSIVTNKPEPFVAPILRHLGIEPYFDLILGAESVAYKKPHPTPLLHVCEQFGTGPDRSLMVGDSKNDILAAKAAGMQSVGVAWGYNYDEPVEAYGPDAVIGNFEELLQLLGVNHG